MTCVCHIIDTCPSVFNKITKMAAEKNKHFNYRFLAKISSKWICQTQAPVEINLKSTASKNRVSKSFFTSMKSKIFWVKTEAHVNK